MLPDSEHHAFGVSRGLRAVRPSLVFLLTLWWLYLITGWLMATFGAEYTLYRQSFAFLLVPYIALIPCLCVSIIVEYCIHYWNRLTTAGRFLYAIIIYDMYSLVLFPVTAAVLQPRLGGYMYFDESSDSGWPMFFMGFALFYSAAAVVCAVSARILKH